MENGWKMGGKTETGGPFHCISVAFDAVFSHTVDAACNKSDENKNKTFAIFNYSSEKRRKKFAVCFNYRAKSETESKKSSRVFHIFPFFIYIHIYIFFFFADEAHFDERIAATTTSQLWQHGNKEKRNNSRT